MPGVHSTFRTALNANALPFKLRLQSRVITAGSCFSDAMGNRLLESKIDTLNNPFGTIFNPAALFRLLNASAATEYSFEHDFIEHKGIWYSYSLHSSFSGASEAELKQKIDSAIETTSDYLRSGDVLMITLGTAVAYKLVKNGRIVANCHKIPQINFTKHLLSSADIVYRFNELYERLLHINPKLKILLTVSPVRHIKDTLEINSVSKAILRVACHEICTNYPQQVFYFPSYEIMMDDLRDYRFYANDMLHPSILAEDYIWEQFTNACFDDELKRFMDEWEYIRKALTHKAFHPQSEAHQQFLHNIFDRLHRVQHDFHVNVSNEIKLLDNQFIA